MAGGKGAGRGGGGITSGGYGLEGEGKVPKSGSSNYHTKLSTRVTA